MVQIHIKGGRKSQRNKISDAIVFAAYELCHWRMADNLEINVELKKIHGTPVGFCMWADDNIKPREFDIELDKTQSDEELLVTVMHEMVHASQYANGRLRERFVPRHRVDWMDGNKVYDNTKYKDLPWEQEAYQLQEVLYENFIERRC